MKRPHLAATGVGWEGAPRFMQVCFSVLPRQARSLEGRDPASSNCAQVGLLVSKTGALWLTVTNSESQRKLG